MTREPEKKIQFQDNENATGLQFLGIRGWIIAYTLSLEELFIGEMAGS